MIEVYGHKIYAPFIFVCDGKVYSSHSGTRWSVNFTRYGTKAWGNTTWAEQDVTRACPDGRNSEVNAAFRKVIKGHFRLKDNQIASFLKQQADEKKQILVEGKSVKRHISSSNNGSASAQSAPVETPLPETAIGTLIKALIKRGCSESRVMEYIEWERQQQLTGNLTGVKLDVRLKMFLGTYEEPAVEPEPEAVEPEQPDTHSVDMTHLPYASGIRWVRQNKRRRWGYRIKQAETLEVLGFTLPDHIFQPAHGWCESYRWDTRDEAAEAMFALLASLTGAEFYVSTPTAEPEPELVEERDHREDVPFYGRRRRDQASFRSDVALNCGDRCVYTGASAIRCEAAHLVAHARRGGASFKNGLLLRSDLHTLFDAGLCAIDPATLQIWFAPELLETDADLQRINGAKMRPTMMPINAENLAARWTEFGAIQETKN